MNNTNNIISWPEKTKTISEEQDSGYGLFLCKKQKGSLLSGKLKIVYLLLKVSDVIINTIFPNLRMFKWNK